MKSVFEHSTVNELREMQDVIHRWMRDRRALVNTYIDAPGWVQADVRHGKSLTSAYQVMFTFYGEILQELKKRMEITNG